MWIKKYSQVFPEVNKAVVWRIWADINRWHEWHDDLEYCKLEGEFAVGNAFILKPRDAPAVKITLLEIEAEQKFTDCTQFFGAKMYDTHELEETPQGLCLTNTLKVQGPLAWLWVKLVAQRIADTVPQEMAALIQLAKTPRG